MTLGEQKLWEALRKRKLNFRRQAPLGRYIVDFIQHGAKLVVEVDGGVHDLPDVQLQDAYRDGWVRSQGYEVMRVKNDEAVTNPHGVADRIATVMSSRGMTL